MCGEAAAGDLLGTHAHEMTSMTQQLLSCYDQEAGRRCGLKVQWVVVTLRCFDMLGTEVSERQARILIM
jgi:hypothetical protein